jgi:hypothetical protein
MALNIMQAFEKTTLKIKEYINERFGNLPISQNGEYTDIKGLRKTIKLDFS